MALKLFSCDNMGCILKMTIFVIIAGRLIALEELLRNE